MKLKVLFGSGVVFGVVSLFSSIHLTSCTKETVHDTTTVTVHDTITKIETDTLIQIDTVCRLRLGLVAHYNFKNGSLLDLTDNHNDIIDYSATPTEDIKGEPDNAFLFDGAHDFMRVANSSSLNPHNITLMARVKVNGFYQGTCHFSDLISKGSTDYVNGFYVLRIADPYGHCFDLPDETKEFFVGGFGDNDVQGAAAGVMGDTSYIQKGRWYTVVYTYDGSTSKIYVNGKLKNEAAKAVTSSGNNNDLFIGRHEDASFPYYFNGIMDEVRIYDRAVNAKEAEVLSIP